MHNVIQMPQPAVRTIGLARLARLRPVTGYPQAHDWTVDQPAPESDGIFKVNAATGRQE